MTCSRPLHQSSCGALKELEAQMLTTVEKIPSCGNCARTAVPYWFLVYKSKRIATGVRLCTFVLLLPQIRLSCKRAYRFKHYGSLLHKKVGRRARWVSHCSNDIAVMDDLRRPNRCWACSPDLPDSVMMNLLIHGVTKKKTQNKYYTRSL